MTSEERVIMRAKEEREWFKREYVRWQRYYEKMNESRTIPQDMLPCHKLRERTKTPTKVVPFHFRLDQRRAESL